jgi:hypothetical protein
MSDFTVINSKEAELFRKLKQLYVDVCELTINHNVLEDCAIVYPSDLGTVLEKVDSKWWNQQKNGDEKRV